jgi:hypothetical protein
MDDILTPSAFRAKSGEPTMSRIGTFPGGITGTAQARA